jgi:hypothetical protein
LATSILSQTPEVSSIVRFFNKWLLKMVWSLRHPRLFCGTHPRMTVMKAKPPPTLREALRQPETVAARLSVAERLLLFCITSHTDWQKPGVTGATVTAMAVRGLIERDAAARLSLTDEGREVLAALLLGRVPSRSPDGRDSEAEVGSFAQPLARPSSAPNGARRHCFRR